MYYVIQAFSWECIEKKYFSLFLNLNICWGYSKELYQWAPATYAKTDGQENIYKFMHKNN